MGSRFLFDKLVKSYPITTKSQRNVSNRIILVVTPQLAKAIYETNDPDYFPQIKLTTTPDQDADLPLTEKAW